MAARRWGAVAVLVLAMTAGLVACDPPAGSGLAITAVTKTTGLNPGDTVDVRVTGAQAGQKVLLYQCAGVDSCWPGAATATADRNGAVTVRWTVPGTASTTSWDWPYPAKTGSCRPPTTCRLYVATGRGSQGEAIGVARTSVAFGLTGRQVQLTATPTTDLRGGERITVRGTALGAAGRQVRIARMDHFRPHNEETWTKVGSSVYVTVRSDGSFSGTYTLPADPAEADCSDGEPTRGCELSAWVVKADGSAIDPTFGKPTIGLGFA
ncbi:MAG TPA: neocarzinostatin apoprotein domain-containing protein [Iamia sp.]|jgi:hypothetical protein|nr:neocarzinostatin apoprotein domain-containing protein [Iamia sp.]